ncbi:MAG: hypothetical protein A3I61_16845 [Acidobacteria bacterium RIFCSPLOWO2_02_FULL_68_18]|nr:MAG: hypothetical protein A3I61_16845 [Acidobacteria bacterium RIFCSPLOWO2_02_FULL_68_18]OFW50157.1 MAG: hypothetical protein A3G77_09225 [Acidobacteria bacterium RIFCSPLOWO2_12_FULL_68_19]
MLIAHGDACYRTGLRALIEAVSDFAVAGEASDGDAAVRLARQLEPDVVLLGLAMSGLDGLGVLQQLDGLRVRPRVICVAGAVDNGEALKALELGARGVFLTTACSDLFAKAIRCVMRGEYWVTREHVKDLIGALVEARSTPTPPPGKRPFNLSPRELDVVKLVVGALSNREIAQALSLSEETVKHHVCSIFNKTGASNRLELALFAIHHRLVQSDHSFRS